MRINTFKFHLFVTCFAACDITSVIHFVFVFLFCSFGAGHLATGLLLGLGTHLIFIYAHLGGGHV